MELFRRNVLINIEDILFDMQDYKIEFDVQFSSDSENISEVLIYNLNKNTANQIQIGDRIRIKAGYGNKPVSIFQGIIDDLEIKYESVDNILKLYCVDNMETFDYKFTGREFVRRFRKNITAEEIINILINDYGLAVKDIFLRNNKKYKRGYITEGTLIKSIENICTDCESQLIIENGVMEIRPNRYSTDGVRLFNQNKLILINQNSGLIQSPKVVKAEASDLMLDQENIEEIDNVRKILQVSEYNVNILLNPDINIDTRVQIESNTANGIYVVQEGKHICNDDFRTELRVKPMEIDGQIPTLIK